MDDGSIDRPFERESHEALTIQTNTNKDCCAFCRSGPFCNITLFKPAYGMSAGAARQLPFKRRGIKEEVIYIDRENSLLVILGWNNVACYNDFLKEIKSEADNMILRDSAVKEIAELRPKVKNIEEIFALKYVFLFYNSVKAIPHNSGMQIALGDFSSDGTKSAGNPLWIGEYFGAV